MGAEGAGITKTQTWWVMTAGWIPEHITWHKQKGEKEERNEGGKRAREGVRKGRRRKETLE